MAHLNLNLKTLFENPKTQTQKHRKTPKVGEHLKFVEKCWVKI